MKRSMPGKYLFEYAVVRVVPKVEREEFLNAGVILFSKDLKFLRCRHSLNRQRLQAFCKDLDCREVEDHLFAFEKICHGDADGGPIALLDLPSRFRWLTATRSTVVQTSKVHPGFTDDPVKTLERLFEQLVL
jgi:hypothetical protein